MATQPHGQVIPPGTDDDEEILSGGSLSQLEEADRSHQVATAQKFPRRMQKFVDDLTELACLSQETAQAMIYSLPRAGKQLVGPSIRFAEAAVSCWRNVRAGVEVIDVDRREGVVTAEGRFYDCETNVGLAVRVRRRIVAKKIDGDSIQITGAAASSIALRGAILRGVPQALWLPVFEKAKATAAGENKSVDEVRGRLIAVFTTLGITEARVFKALGVPGSADIGKDEILAMQAWHRQLKAKDSTIEDIFGSPARDEVEDLMAALQWNEAKRKLSDSSFKGNLTGQLEYLRAEVAKMGGAARATMGSTENKPNRPTPVTEMPKPEVDQAQPDPTQSAQQTASDTPPPSSTASTPTQSTSSQTSKSSAPATKKVTPDW